MGRMILSTKDKKVAVYRALPLIDNMLRKITWGLFRYGGANLHLSSEDYKAIKTLTDDIAIKNACDRKDSSVLRLLSEYLAYRSPVLGGRDRIHLIEYNTVVSTGGDLLRFLADLSAWCEAYGYIHEDDKLYFAGILERGIKINILPKTIGRDNVLSGWEGVIDMLKESTGHVVLSYSVCDVFPWGYVKACYACDEGELFEGLSHEERWDYATGELLKDKARRIHRDRKTLVGKGVTIMDINKQIEDFIDTLKD